MKGSCLPMPSGSARTRAATSSSVTPAGAEEVLERARLLDLPARIVARISGSSIVLKGEAELPLADLRAVHEAWLPSYMSAPHTN